MVAVDSPAKPGPTAGGSGCADDAGDEQRLADLAGMLATGVVEALPGWVVACVERRSTQWQGSCPPALVSAASEAGARAARELGPALRDLLASDVDDQRTNPLAIVRQATRYPTGVLRDAGVPGVVRDAEAERQFPNDDYDLTPAAFADLDEDLGDLGILWGAAKARVVLARRRREGRT